MYIFKRPLASFATQGCLSQGPGVQSSKRVAPLPPSLCGRVGTYLEGSLLQVVKLPPHMKIEESPHFVSELWNPFPVSFFSYPSQRQQSP